jgi:hypothetical protein
MVNMPISNARQSDRDAVVPRNTDRKEDKVRLRRPGRLTREGRFAIDESRVPDGMVMEWKRVRLMGAEDRSNQIISQRNHWVGVPHEVQPHILGHLGKQGEIIEQDGLMLMMRQQYLNDDAWEEQQHETTFQLDQQLTSLKLKSREEVGPQRTKIQRTYERNTMPIE